MAKTNKGTATEDTSTVPALVVTPNRAPVITGNFDDMERYLVRNRDKYKNVDFSTANMVDVLRVKKEMQVLRTSTEKIEKDVNDTLFNNPKKIMKGNFARLYALIAEVETPLDDIIDKDDQKRIDGINFAIDEYIKEFTADSPLVPKYLARIERKKGYYNKTQDEADTRNDILAQITALQKEQKAEAANKRLIEKACAEDKRLSSALYLNLLDRGDDIASIIEAIDAEKARLNGVDNETRADEKASGSSNAEEEAEAYETDMVDEAGALDYESDLPTRTKTITVEITYPADVGDSLTKLFALLHERGIKSKVVK